MTLISEPVTVHLGDGGMIEAFTWRGIRHVVAEQLSNARRVDFHSPWYLRRHQRRVLVKTEDGGFYELYADRPGHWVLYRKLDDPFQS
ncbi:DUF6504 family protein [Sulfobacillus harzensis]|uniref:DUF6504 domain-containing protein n=1 Tax=Sulfobacillus harzensis TaxID=2729629 RepID=A0A7Y0L7I2_9FIRM|nr:DUF6504 family protein [Sulfobacillus harzensis]NMP24448.1 hypothetical protein [Sulfobacillus harzensis]